MDDTGNPIFEIITDDSHIKIYANGVVEGCDKKGRIVNHICTAIRPAFAKFFSKPIEWYAPSYSTLNLPSESAAKIAQFTPSSDFN